jgi:ABC-type transport system involved in cytochrome bd biosynthesis fused ATPase/permease subunit
LRKPLASAYLHNQSMTNRMTARTYNAWDNVTAGNRHNLQLWQRDFRARWDQALAAQVRAILMREGWSAASGVIALLIILSATAWVAFEDAGNAALLIGLAATLPRQLEMTLDMHQLTAGLTELIAIWARMQGACEHLRPIPDCDFDTRIQFAMITLRINEQDRPVSSLAEALSLIHGQPVGRIAVRGANGAGKSTLLTALKGSLRGSAYYWPNHDRLSFRFNTRTAPVAMVETEEDEAPEAEEISASESALEKAGYSSGERQLQVLRELVAHTDNPVYLLDEWDANLDRKNREEAEQLLQRLAQRARVIEVSHHRG